MSNQQMTYFAGRINEVTDYHIWDENPKQIGALRSKWFQENDVWNGARVQLPSQYEIDNGMKAAMICLDGSKAQFDDLVENPADCSSTSYTLSGELYDEGSTVQITVDQGEL